MKFPSEGKFHAVLNMVENFINFFDNIMPIFYFPLQGSKIFTHISPAHVDVKKGQICIIKEDVYHQATCHGVKDVTLLNITDVQNK